MVMEFLGHNVEQCDQANARFGLNNCCNAPTPGPCVQGGWPEFYKWGFSSQHTNSAALTPAQLKTEIDAKRPVAFSWAWTGGGGHMMVATGYSILGKPGTLYVSINDPWPPNVGDQRTITYALYVKGPDHVHWDDYFDVKHTHPKGKAPAGAAPSPHPAKGTGMPGEPGKGVAVNDKEKAVEGSRTAAKEALDTFRELHKGKMDAPGANAGLGDPFPIVFVRLDRLKNKESGPGALTEGGISKVLYPVVAGEKVAGSVEVHRADDKWEAGAFGGGALARLLTEARAGHMKAEKKKASDYFTVAIPALNQYFVATKDGDKLLLIPVLDDPTLELKAGQAQDAKDLYPRLMAAAQKHNGDPG
jgi:hypothetical protein